MTVLQTIMASISASSMTYKTWTLEWWQKVPATQANQRPIPFGQGQADYNFSGVYLEPNRSTVDVFTGKAYGAAAASYTADVWEHWCIMSDTNPGRQSTPQLRVYRNGIVVAGSERDGHFGKGDIDFDFGFSSASGMWTGFAGKLAGFRITRDALMYSWDGTPGGFFKPLVPPSPDASGLGSPNPVLILNFPQEQLWKDQGPSNRQPRGANQYGQGTLAWDADTPFANKTITTGAPVNTPNPWYAYFGDNTFVGGQFDDIGPGTTVTCTAGNAVGWTGVIQSYDPQSGNIVVTSANGGTQWPAAANITQLTFNTHTTGPYTATPTGYQIYSNFLYFDKDIIPQMFYVQAGWTYTGPNGASGTVVRTFDAGQYRYVEVSNAIPNNGPNDPIIGEWTFTNPLTWGSVKFTTVSQYDFAAVGFPSDPYFSLDTDY